MEKEKKYFSDELNDSEIDFTDAPESGDDELLYSIPARKIFNTILSKANLSFCKENVNTNVSYALNSIIHDFSDAKAAALFGFEPKTFTDKEEIEMQQQFERIDNEEIAAGVPVKMVLASEISQANIDFCKKYSPDSIVWAMNRIIYAYRKELEQK